MTPLIEQSSFAAAKGAEKIAARAAARACRVAAATSLQQARATFAENAEVAYSSGRRLADRDGDSLEEIAALIVETVDRLHPCFERLDVAADISAYAGPNGRRFARATWERKALALAFAEALQSQLGDDAFAVLAAAVRLHAAD